MSLAHYSPDITHCTSIYTQQQAQLLHLQFGCFLRVFFAPMYAAASTHTLQVHFYKGGGEHKGVMDNELQVTFWCVCVWWWWWGVTRELWLMNFRLLVIEYHIHNNWNEGTEELKQTFKCHIGESLMESCLLVV